MDKINRIARNTEDRVDIRETDPELAREYFDNDLDGIAVLSGHNDYRGSVIQSVIYETLGGDTDISFKFLKSKSKDKGRILLKFQKNTGHIGDDFKDPMPFNVNYSADGQISGVFFTAHSKQVNAETGLYRDQIKVMAVIAVYNIGVVDNNEIKPLLPEPRLISLGGDDLGSLDPKRDLWDAYEKLIDIFS